MEIENHLRAEKPGDQPGQHEKVRHVVHVDKVITLGKRTPHDDGGGREKKCDVLVEVPPDAAAATRNRDAADGNAVELFAPGVPVFPQADQLDGHAFPGERLRGTPWTWIRRIIGKQNHRNAFGGHRVIGFMGCRQRGIIGPSMASATPAQGGQRIRLGGTALAWLNLYQNLKQIVQDAIAPEIQSIKGDIRALETQVSALRTELRAFEDRTEKRFDQMNRQWELAIEVRERLATVEAQLKHR